jgi:thymidylate synthase (FAD)
MSVKLVWLTPDAEKLLVHIARVSNPASQAEGANPERLIRYLIKHHHWSPFQMVGACVEIETTRDIGRQILRHSSFGFQEFSQRYAVPGALPPASKRRARIQDAKNRQSSFPTTDAGLLEWWDQAQQQASDMAIGLYDAALSKGIAKEVARAVLPEGLTMSRMFMSGTIRSFYHYCELRTSPETQLEHRSIAWEIRSILAGQMPATFATAEGA